METNLQALKFNHLAEIVESWENERVLWYTKHKNRYEVDKMKYSHEGNYFDNWSGEHKAYANFIRNGGYCKNHGIPVREWWNIKYLTLDQIKSKIVRQADKKFMELVINIENEIGYIKDINRLEENHLSVIGEKGNLELKLSLIEGKISGLKHIRVIYE